VLLSEDDPHVETVTAIWKTADWHERETFDLFGVIFDGHPDLVASCFRATSTDTR
jgi:NADH-quinone oxidoreductase subunit C